jgi:hypothetical protein
LQRGSDLFGNIALDNGKRGTGQLSNIRNTIRETNISKSRKRRRQEQTASARHPVKPQTPFQPAGNSELPPAGKRGAAAALERLEFQEEESHRRLQVALERGNQFELQSAQEYWLKCSETLRRLDLAIEVSRRTEEQQIPLKVAQDAVLFAAEWMRIAVAQFLSAETTSLMGIKDPGEFRFYFGQRFKGILDLTVMNADKTRSAIPH